ncbi:MAG: beta-ketoacyl-ACP synthase II [Lentisphaeria bacterium]|nr:beta-ketoacyl-ACP synthase II [Lentisphaeria bacterium]
MNERRVVVTGAGVVSSVGVGVDVFWQSLVEGKSGITATTSFDASQMRCRIAGEIKDFDITNWITPKEARRLDVFCHYAVAAADEAVKQSGLTTDPAFNPTRAGALIGCGIGGVKTLQEQSRVLETRGPSKSSPLMVPMMILDMASGFVSIQHQLRGPNFAVVSACASASHAIGEAMWTIKRGDADAMVTGGTEACLCELGVAGFSAMKALSERNDDPQRASRPFDAERDGFVPSEGAGILVLEELEHAKARGADILGEIVGYGSSGDAYHITAPDATADGPKRAMEMAMAHAGVTPAQMGYINAHGTSTPLNDKTETLAIKKAFGDAAYKIAVSSTKSMTGHALGAAGGLESIAVLMALKTGIVPPTVNYENPDPDCDLDYVPNTARQVNPIIAMNTNLGFGGHNAALIFRKF